jgi:XTP/dITP diphosphohydrolase
MMEIVVATKNQGKVAEITVALADLPVKVLSLHDFGFCPEAVENGNTFEANAILKATHYSLITGKPCLADDSGLEVDALHGAPGVYSARYAGEGATEEACNKKLLAELSGVPAEERTARFRCVLAYVDPNGTLLTAEGASEGVILEAPQGTGGFGYDPLFYVPSFKKTYAELTVDEKNVISHRGQALRNMAMKLVKYYHENRCD